MVKDSYTGDFPADLEGWKARSRYFESLYKVEKLESAKLRSVNRTLARQDSSSALSRRIRHYVAPTLLAIDEVGYLSYDTRYADLFVEVVTRRYQERPVAISTNKPFGQWSEVFPNAACVVTLIDRLVHKAEIVPLEGKSYRLKEAEERAARKAAERAARKAQRAAAEAEPD